MIRAMLDAGYERVDYTYASNPLPDVSESCVGHVADVATGRGVREAIDAALRSGGLDVVVNCAAISSPGACEKDPDAANATNVPKHLLVALRERFPPVTRGDTGQDPAAKKPLFVHLSTDQVYAGDSENNLEGHGAHVAPVNAYGRSKLAAERMTRESWPHAQTVVLRSSIITGPQSPFAPVKRPLFLEFVAEALRRPNVETVFYEDEFRCPIAAADLARHILVLAAAKPGTARGVFNAGGPDRLSRVDMAKRARRRCTSPTETSSPRAPRAPTEASRRRWISPWTRPSWSGPPACARAAGSCRSKGRRGCRTCRRKREV